MYKIIKADLDFFAVALHQVPITIKQCDEIIGQGIVEKYTPDSVKLLSRDGTEIEYFLRRNCTFLVDIK